MKKLIVLAFGSLSILSAEWKQADPPALPQSGMPFLTSGPDKTLYLSWIDPLDQGHALRVSRWSGTAWLAPETVAQGTRWFVNWADFPSVQVLQDGSMLAHWLARPAAGGKYGYGIRVARRSSGQNGKWVEVAAMNENDPEDYAGFLSFGGKAAAYLSPPARRTPSAAHSGHGSDEDGVKTLRVATFGADGKIAADAELDNDVCSCCQTSMAHTNGGLLVAYRDHLPGEIRDISVVRYSNGKWSSPVPLHRDGWKINGCPTEGPSVAAAGNTVGVAWITRANESSRLQVAMSKDGGEHFASPIRGDDGNPLGRPNLTRLDDKQMLMVWLERTPEGAEVRLRRVFADGTKAKSITIAKVEASRSTGLPKVGMQADKVVVAWRNGQVRSGWLPLSDVPSQVER